MVLWAERVEATFCCLRSVAIWVRPWMCDLEAGVSFGKREKAGVGVRETGERWRRGSNGGKTHSICSNVFRLLNFVLFVNGGVPPPPISAGAPMRTVLFVTDQARVSSVASCENDTF
jgi:hypothetical protein